MKICDIIYREEYILSEVDDDLEFDRIITDLSNTENGDLLIVPNEKSPLDFSRVKTLPVAVICNQNTVLPDNIPRILVNNPRLAWSNACFRYENIGQRNMKFIAVTGTNGKTTTATLIRNILTEVGYKVGFIGTGRIEVGGNDVTPKDYSMTTPDPPLLYRCIGNMEREKCDAVVMEASSHSLALEKLAPIEFDYALFTNMSAEHLDFHGDMESYFKAKMKLIQKSKCSIINIDDEYGKRAYEQCIGRKISTGILWRGDVWIDNISNLGFGGISYTYHGDDFSFKMQLPLPGRYNSYNSMLAAALCIDMGCKPCDVKRILADTSPAPGRYEVINDRISVIIDYAHTSTAFKSILAELSSIKGAGRLTVVFGCGGDRDRAKRPQMAKIAEQYADRVILTADNSRKESTKNIISDIIQGFERGSYEIKENREDAIRSAIIGAKDGDIVAIIGKGPEKYNIDRNGYHPFDEREIINNALAERRRGAKYEN